MASTVLNTPPTFTAPTAYVSTAAACASSPKTFFRPTPTRLPVMRCRHSTYNWSTVKFPTRFEKFSSFSANEDNVEVQIETEEKDESAPKLESEPEIAEPEIEQQNPDGVNGVESTAESEDAVAAEPNSAVVASLNMYKEALANGDETKVAEVESFLKSIEDEKIDLEKKVAALSEELSYEKARILRISADFDNFRKRTDRERISLVTNAQGEVVETLLPVLDNFERAKAQIKLETEGEEKISNSYQSISKQFGEILVSLGVIPVETIGKPFDPELHEAIMREDSTEYEEGVIIEEYRKGFQLGNRLLRPSMVKVSAGPGPAKSETVEPSETQEEVGEPISAEAAPAEE